MKSDTSTFAEKNQVLLVDVVRDITEIETRIIEIICMMDVEPILSLDTNLNSIADLNTLFPFVSLAGSAKIMLCFMSLQIISLSNEAYVIIYIVDIRIIMYRIQVEKNKTLFLYRRSIGTNFFIRPLRKLTFPSHHPAPW